MSTPCAGNCPICGRYFVKKLKTHMALHDSTRPFKCEYSCTELYFLTKGVQSTHYSEWHRDEHNNRQWTCPTCNATMGGRQRLMHERKHMKPEKPQRRSTNGDFKIRREFNNNNNSSFNNNNSFNGSFNSTTDYPPALTFAPISTPNSVEMIMPSSSESPSSDVPPILDGFPLDMPIPQPTCSFEETAIDAILSGAHHLVSGTVQAHILALPPTTKNCVRALFMDIYEINRLWSIISWRKAVSDQEWQLAIHKVQNLLYKHPNDFHKLREKFLTMDLGIM